MIQTKGLTRMFGAHAAVAGLDLSIGAGTIYGFLGPNGAGKTTTLRMLTGLMRPTSGSARVAGLDVVSQGIEVRRHIGFLPDQPFLYESLTVAEFLTFVADMFGLDESARTLTEPLLERFEVASWAGARMGTLSLGTSKKVALVAVLMRNPSVLFLDEPTSGLDPRAVATLRDLLIERSREGTTVFFSTHILEAAQRIAHRLGILNRGRLVAEGTFAELAQRAHGGQDLEAVFLSLTAATAADSSS